MGWFALSCYWYPWLKPQLFPSMSLSASKGKQPGHGTKLPAAHSAQKGLCKEKRYQPLPSSSLTASEAHKSCKLFFLKLHVLKMEMNALIAWYKRHTGTRPQLLWVLQGQIRGVGEVAVVGSVPMVCAVWQSKHTHCGSSGYWHLGSSVYWHRTHNRGSCSLTSPEVTWHHLFSPAFT